MTGVQTCALPILVLETAKSLREDFLHQNAFHEIDTYASMEKQFKMLRMIVRFHHLGLDALHRGAPMNELRTADHRKQNMDPSARCFTGEGRTLQASQ